MPALCVEENSFAHNTTQLFSHVIGSQQWVSSALSGNNPHPQTSSLTSHLKGVEEKPLENRRLANLFVTHHHQAEALPVLENMSN